MTQSGIYTIPYLYSGMEPIPVIARDIPDASDGWYFLSFRKDGSCAFPGVQQQRFYDGLSLHHTIDTFSTSFLIDTFVDSQVWTDGAVSIEQISHTANDVTVLVTIPGSPLPPPPNQSPVADAGSNQSKQDVDMDGIESFTLNGSGSFDPDGAIVSYEWSIQGSVVGTGANPVITLPIGVYTVTLTVTDDEGATGTDTMAITVSECIPHPSPNKACR